MLKKLGIIALLFLGSIILVFGLIKPVFENVIGINVYVHVILGIIILIIGVILYKKYCTE